MKEADDLVGGIEAVLGATFHSRVFKIKMANGGHYVMKINQPFKDPLQVELMREIGDISHPNLLTPLEIAEEDGRIIEFYPYIPHPTLYQRHGKQPDPETAKLIVLQILLGLSPLHRRGIIHHDVREPNIFVNPKTDEVTLFDYNISKKPYFLRTGMSTINNVPPEYLVGCTQIDYRFDIYQTGIILRDLTHGYDWAKETFIPVKGVTPELVQVIINAIHPDPDKRYRTAMNMAEALDKLI
ncbi:protein kinase [Candidatus Woesearchaeota archaeon]|jgi:serine/threonine protein kinase|nr:protein kinase [Candidatus Woesearchaeota archaeon]